MRLTPNPHAKELGIATIGDTDREKTFEVNHVRWDCNGTLFVTLHARTNEINNNAMRRAHRLARRCLMYPEKTRSCRLITSKTNGDGLPCLTYAVSRNDP